MRTVCAALVAIAVLAGCSSPPRPEPVLHDPTYRELPPAPPWVAGPAGAEPDAQTIKRDVFRWTYTHTLDPDTAKVEYVGAQAGPPDSRKEPPFVAKGDFGVWRSMMAYAGPVWRIQERQPANIVAVWINGGSGFKPHIFYYLDGKLDHVDDERG